MSVFFSAIMICLAYTSAFAISDSLLTPAQDSLHPLRENIKLPTQVREIRAYGGGNETLPPVILRDPKHLGLSAAFGERDITIEFDVNSDVPPSVYLRFVHCNALWKEDHNVFLDDITMLRTSNVTWYQSGRYSSYYTYRGKISVPNQQVEFKFAGNWKAKIFEYGQDEQPLAEVRFFVVDLQATCDVALFSDFYEPKAKVSPVALAIEASVSTPQTLFDNQLNTVVIYRNHRWYEPMIISQEGFEEAADSAYNYARSSTVFGFAGVTKRFRITGVPAQNEYRVLELDNTLQYPSSSFPVRLPLPDLRRNGSYDLRADDGAMITYNVLSSYDEYLNVEFTLDPEKFPSRYDVFLAGSFNDWKITPEWQMYYDEKDNLYRLRQWVRRARHNYLYATGRTRADYQNVDAITFEEFEGNTLSAGHTFLAFVYYHEIAYGGYDTIIGVGAANIFGQIGR